MSDNFGFFPIEELNQENRRITEEQNQQVNLGHENQFMNDVNLHAERQIG